MSTTSARVTFEPSGQTVKVTPGVTLLAAAHQAGVAIDAPCGGTGRCGSCRVRAEGALTPLTPDERDLLGGASVTAGWRLACRARVTGDVVVTAPVPSGGMRVLGAGAVDAVAVEPPAARGIDGLGALVGAAVDLGTTTIALLLVDLRTGAVLASAGGANPQRVSGADVLSRVAHATSGGAGELRLAAGRAVGSLLTIALDRAGRAAETLAEAVVVGNTAMMGLLAGADVAPLGEAPYAGAPIAERRVPAHETGASGFPSLDFVVPAGAGAFIGSDITAGVLAADVADASMPTLFIDLGTNGEIVLATGAELLAASTAAGPALEGASISHGMRAERGAVERVWLEGEDVRLGVIGDVAPAGICGSGLLDLMALLLDAGVLDGTGRLAEDATGPLGARLTERDGVRAFVVDDASDVLLTQKDVRQVQLALGAVRAGVASLLAEADMVPDDVGSVVIAGGFGYHVRAVALVRLGLLPAAWEARVRFAGNTALDGARRLLLDSAERVRVREIAARMRVVDLAARPDFEGRFLASLTFPEA